MKLKLIVYSLGIALTSAIVVGAQAPSPSLSGEGEKLSVDELNRRNIERRAVEAFIWGMPVVNYDLMLQEMLTKTPGKVGQVIYWGRPLDWHNQTLTPNPDALYFHGILEHQGRPGCAQPVIGRRQRIVQRQHRQYLADG